MNDYTTCRELKPYLEPTKAMRLGAPGKFGSLDLVFELDKDKKSIMRHWDRRAPLIVQQELYFDEGMPEMPCVYILSSGGPNVDGDRYENRFTVRKDAYAYISTGAATKIAEMVYNFSGLNSALYWKRMPILNICPKRLSLAVTVVILLIRISKSIRLRLYSIRRSIWEEGNITEKGNCSNTTCYRFVHGPTDPTVRFCSVRNWLPSLS